MLLLAQSTSLPILTRFIASSQLEDVLLYVKREKEAVDLKVYYQERRLKGLGLDSPWSEEDSGGEFNSGMDMDL